jgi:hypothetical protein
MDYAMLLKRMWFAHRSLAWMALISLGSLLGAPLPASAISITISAGSLPNDPGPLAGGVTLTDNGAMDLDPLAGVIRFNSAGAGAAGFAMPGGYVASGSVKTGGGGALAGVANITNIVNLTEFDVMRPAGAAGGQVSLSFVETFAGPPAPVDAADNIQGEFRNAAGTVNTGFVNFRGSVNGDRIGLAFAQTSVAVGSPTAFNQGPHVIRGVRTGPAWLLRGEVSFLLGPADRLALPNSAEVGIGRAAAVPEPSSLALVGVGILALLGKRRARHAPSASTHDVR